VEWYSWTGEEGLYWNQNSSNGNHLGGKNEMPMFTHWMILSEKTRTKLPFDAEKHLRQIKEGEALPQIEDYGSPPPKPSGVRVIAEGEDKPNPNKKQKEYAYPIFKCRRCGKMVVDERDPLKGICYKVWFHPNNFMNIDLNSILYHRCSDTKIGICNYVGWDMDEKQASEFK